MAKKKKSAADFARRSNATSRMGRHSPTTQVRFRELEGMPAGEPAPTRPTPRPARGSNLAPISTRDKPVPRPSTAEERAAGARGNRQDPGPIAKDMKAGGKVKKTRAGGGNMSSESLERRITADSLARDRAIGDTYRDRGAVGRRKAVEESIGETREYLKDKELIDTYGRDAPNARSFNTRRAAGGKVKKMAMGGKCRGMGKATRGGNFSRG